MQGLLCLHLQLLSNGGERIYMRVHYTIFSTWVRNYIKIKSYKKFKSPTFKNNNLLQHTMKEKIPFSKEKQKYLGINFKKNSSKPIGRKLFKIPERHKTDLNDTSHIAYSLLKSRNITKMLVIPKLMYILNAISIKIPTIISRARKVGIKIDTEN